MRHPTHKVRLTLILVLLLASGPQRAWAVDFTIGENFTGTELWETFFTGSEGIPPDTMGSVGPNHVVELINTNFSVYNKKGELIQSPISLDDFWTNAGVTPTVGSFDPRIIYDHDSERWFATSVDNALSPNDILLAVSNSSDPTAGWTGFSVDSDASDTRWADFPTMGIDRDGVYIAANMFTVFDGPSPPPQVSVFSFPKADLLAATPTIAGRTSFQQIGLDRGFSIQPAVDFGPSDGRAALLATDFFEFGTLNRSNITNADGPGPAALSAATDIDVDATSLPGLAHQPIPGRDNIDGGDDRMSANVFEQGDSLWAVHSIDVDGRIAVRWYEIDETNNSVLQSGTISDSLLDLYYPSIAANADGDVVIGFSGSGNTQPISTYAAVGATSAGTTTFSDVTLLKEGNSTYDLTFGSGRNRWGDYSATVIDPTDDKTFWTFQEYVSNVDNWAIQITEIKIDGSPAPLVMLGDGVVGDEQTSILYDAGTGEVMVDAPSSADLSSLNIASAASIFSGDPAQGLGGTFDIDTDATIFKADAAGFGNFSLGKIAQVGLSEAFLLGDLAATGSLVGGGGLGDVDLLYIPAAMLAAGDANQDYEFDQYDLIAMSASGKYLLNDGTADWSEGDFSGAPGGTPGTPPVGDGNFDQFDVINALITGNYLQGDYRSLGLSGFDLSGDAIDGQVSLVYDAATGEVSFETPDGLNLTSINLSSASGIFTGSEGLNLDGLFDIRADDTLFKALFGAGFGDLSFGFAAQAGLSEAFVRNDLSVVGSFSGGSVLETVDLIYLSGHAVPEPSTLVLIGLGLVCFGGRRLRGCRRFARRL